MDELMLLARRIPYSYQWQVNADGSGQYYRFLPTGECQIFVGGEWK